MNASSQYPDKSGAAEARRGRLDRVLVFRGLVASRERAQMAVRAGLVSVNGTRITKSSTLVDASSVITLHGEPLSFVGRGGLKLDAALRFFRINASNARCLDVGASTGGFTDCLLQRGAAHVVAIDVGHGQMHPDLVSDPRVTQYEGLNARYLTPGQFGKPFDIITVDVSFISLTLILPVLVPLLRPGGFLVALIKPEFEVGRDAVGEGGVVRDTEAVRRARDTVSQCAANLQLRKLGVIPSPVRSGGNREYLACFRLPKEVSTP